MLPIDSVSHVIAPGGSTGTPPASTGNSKPVESPDIQKLKKAAGDFESILLASMWKAMKHSFSDPKDDSADPANGTIDDWGIEAMSGAVGKTGGLGIGNMIIKHLAPAEAGPTDSKSSADANVLGKLADRTQ
jgi:Rod binding domain-containing protein